MSCHVLSCLVFVLSSISCPYGDAGVSGCRGCRGCRQLCKKSLCGRCEKKAYLQPCIYCPPHLPRYVHIKLRPHYIGPDESVPRYVRHDYNVVKCCCIADIFMSKWGHPVAQYCPLVLHHNNGITSNKASSKCKHSHPWSRMSCTGKISIYTQPHVYALCVRSPRGLLTGLITCRLPSYKTMMMIKLHTDRADWRIGSGELVPSVSHK